MCVSFRLEKSSFIRFCVFYNIFLLLYLLYVVCAVLLSLSWMKFMFIAQVEKFHTLLCIWYIKRCSKTYNCFVELQIDKMCMCYYMNGLLDKLKIMKIVERIKTWFCCQFLRVEKHKKFYFYEIFKLEGFCCWLSYILYILNIHIMNLFLFIIRSETNIQTLSSLFHLFARKFSDKSQEEAKNKINFNLLIVLNCFKKRFSTY